MSEPAKIPVTYVVFDLLWLDDRDLTGLPFLERRQLVEGIVVKRNTSRYLPGKRSTVWITMCRRVDACRRWS